MLEVDREERVPREAFGVRLVYFTSGEFKVQMVAAEEITCTSSGYDFQRPIRITVLNTVKDPEQPVRRESMMVSSLTELADDLKREFQYLGVALTEELLEQIDQLVAKTATTLQTLYIEEYSSAN